MSNIYRAPQTTRIRGFVKKTLAAVTGTACIALFAPAMFAAPITTLGSAVLNAGNGSVQVQGNGSTTGCIDWYNSQTPPSGCQPEGTTGAFTVDGSSTAPFMVGMTGSIKDINFNSPSPLLDFITVALSSTSTAHFDLIGLRFNGATPIGSCTAPADTTSGASCTPANSPFQLQNGIANSNGVVDTVSVSLTLDAWGYIGNSGTNYNNANRYVGRFTTQGAGISGANINDILTTIQSGGAINASWSATLTPVASPVPEPDSYMLLGLALVSITPLMRRRNRKA